MAASTGVSCVLSLVICVLLISGSQFYRQWFSATPLRTIIGGFLSSVLFSTLLTFVGNLESLVLGKGYQAGLFPEVTFSMIGALLTAAGIHRVCVTTCIIFSGISLYYMNQLSQKIYAVPEQPQLTTTHKKKRGH